MRETEIRVKYTFFNTKTGKKTAYPRAAWTAFFGDNLTSLLQSKQIEEAESCLRAAYKGPINEIEVRWHVYSAPARPKAT